MMAPARDRPRILIVGDAVAPTGFARVVRGIFEPLAERYDLHQLAVNYFGDPHDWPWPLYPARREGDPFGAARLEELIGRLAPDLVFLVTDIWGLDLYAPRLGAAARTVFYCPIEAGPVPPKLLAPLGGLDHLVLYTEYGRREIEKAGRDPEARALRLPPKSVLPHGVDTAVFQPLDRARARAELFPDVPEFRDAFIVLNANRNQPRKRIDLTLEAFALFARGKAENVKLYLHMGLEDCGWDLPTLARRFGVDDRLIVTYPDTSLPQASLAYLNTIYNACDVGINTAMAEGWGLVAFEHAATGAPQIVPGFGSCAELWQGAAELLPPARRITQEKTLMECCLIDPADAAAALERLYQDPGHRRRLSEAAYARVTRDDYQWRSISRRWAELFDRLLAEERRPRRRASGTAGPRLRPPYLFLHIPKTGGTSLGGLLREGFGDAAFGQYWHLPGPGQMAEVTGKTCVIGHFPHGLHALFGAPCTYLTMLRNPYERVLSQYFYNLHTPGDPWHRLARDHPLEEWLDLHPDARDLQVQFLSGRKGPAPDGEVLALAKANLAACGLVGLLEDFEGTLLLLCRALGLDRPAAPRLKENPRRPRLHEVSAEAREKIRRSNALDLELYRFGQELFAEQLQAAMAAPD